MIVGKDRYPSWKGNHSLLVYMMYLGTTLRSYECSNGLCAPWSVCCHILAQQVRYVQNINGQFVWNTVLWAAAGCPAATSARADGSRSRHQLAPMTRPRLHQLAPMPRLHRVLYVEVVAEVAAEVGALPANCCLTRQRLKFQSKCQISLT